MCHTETLPPPSSPVAARCQHGQCRLCQIPPSEINTRLPLLFQGNAFSHKVGWFTHTNPKSYGVNTYIQRDCFVLRHFTPLPWRWSWERRHWNCSLHLRNLWAVLNGFWHIQFEVPVQIILVRLRRKTYIIIRNHLYVPRYNKQCGVTEDNTDSNLQVCSPSLSRTNDYSCIGNDYK